MIARTAKRIQFQTLFQRTSCLAGIGLAISGGCLQAQENVLRPALIPLPAIAAAQTPGSAKTVFIDAGASLGNQDPTKPADSGKASKDQDESSSETQPQSRNRGPIVIPNLTIPNTSVRSVGEGETPEDVVGGRMPTSIPLPYGADRYGFWALDNKNWTAPVFCHQPLYFEDVMLERHGQERFPYAQPLVSGARFFSGIALLPYKSYLQRPLEERYSTGYHRPGSAAPCVRQRVPYDAGAMRFQLLTTGTAVLVGQP